MKQLMATTRGTFNLWTGKRLRHKPVYITPKNKFQKLAKVKEIVIFIHGMRNTTVGAKMGTNTLRLRLRKLGYKHPIIGFSYDSNVKGAHIESRYHDTLWTACHIADCNGEKLRELISNIYKVNPSITIRIVAHSLGCEVVKAMLEGGDNPFIESIHLFGSPIENKFLEPENFLYTINVINYYNPNDSVILEGVKKGVLNEPSCLYNVNVFSNMTHIKSKRLYAKDHRFKQQMKALRSFP